MGYYKYPHEGRMRRYVAYSADWQRLGYVDASTPNAAMAVMSRRGVDTCAFVVPIEEVVRLAKQEAMSGQAYMRQLADPWTE